MGPDVSERGFADLTDVTLADDDKNPTLLMMIGNPRQCDVAIYATWWPTLQTMQLHQILKQVKLCHLAAKYATNTSGQTCK